MRRVWQFFRDRRPETLLWRHDGGLRESTRDRVIHRRGPPAGSDGEGEEPTMKTLIKNGTVVTTDLWKGDLW
ncbi:MAG: hypothetical protein R3E12_18270 [Candidatus Eisenbacteria bacterium]